MHRKLTALIFALAIAAVGSPATFAQVNPVFKQDPVSGNATQQQLITVPSGQSDTYNSGSTLDCNGCTLQGFPAGSGTVTGPVSSTIGNLPAWNNAGGTQLNDSGVPATNAATGGANTIKGSLNGTNQVNLAVPSCPTNALGWTSGTGFNCNPITASAFIAGNASNISIVRASTTTLTVKYDSLIESTALNGTPYLSTAGNFTFNGATTGAGGLDTGSLPASGFVVVYGITKGDNTTFSTYGCVTTETGCGGTIYAGAPGLPSGYVASALIGYAPTNASNQFKTFTVLGKHLTYGGSGNWVNVISQTGVTAMTSISTMNTAVPPNAIAVDVAMGTSTLSGAINIEIAADAAGSFVAGCSNVGSGSHDVLFSAGGLCTAIDVGMTSSQTLFWSDHNAQTNDFVTVTGFWR